MFLHDIIQAPLVPTTSAMTVQDTVPHAADVQGPNVTASEMFAPAVVPAPEVPTPVVPAPAEVLAPVSPAPPAPASEIVLAPVPPTRAEVVPTPDDFPMMLTKYGPWGSEKGKYLDMHKDLPQRLVHVSLLHGDFIHIIPFSYTINHSGVKKWGQIGGLPLPGSRIKEMSLQDGEFVKNASGTTGLFDGDARITTLSFVTNLRRYGPFGVEGRHSSFSVHELNNDSSIVGFFGWHDGIKVIDEIYYVHSHGVYVLSPSR